MSEAAGSPSSPTSPVPSLPSVPSVSSLSSVSSVSLLEVKEDTRLVLKAFLRHSLSVPTIERPGRVGGAYKDHNKYSATVRDTKRQSKEDVLNSQDETSSADEKKRGFKDFIKRLQPRSRRPEGEPASPSSTSEEEGSEGKQMKKKKKKLKTQLSFLFRKKKEEKEKENVHPPQRPTSLSIGKKAKPEATVSSPSHSPEFYEGVAETLERIAQRSKSFKRPCTDPTPTPPKLSPGPCTDPTPTPPKLSPARDKDAVVKQLVQVLSTEADTINSKIQSDPFLRSSLTRLSYPSFAKLLDAFASQAEATPPQARAPPPLAEAPPPQPKAPPPPAKPPAAPSPTLRRVAIAMEVSRRVVTATGTLRMRGYAERYMENFSPWVKSQGGWENIVQLEEISEYD